MFKKGFTLIELLIVVAIIAILAAIAVPNFLEAQIRAKTSRVKAELRTLATCIEAYAVDWNKEAPEAGNGQYPELLSLLGDTGNFSGILNPAITTPIAYITSFTFVDPFLPTDKLITADTRLYSYKSFTAEWTQPYLPAPPSSPGKPTSSAIVYNEGAALNGDRFRELYGQWRLFSVGPDRRWNNQFPPIGGVTGLSSPASVGLPYDPTNGTVSLGSIVRSQSQPDQKAWQFVAGQ